LFIVSIVASIVRHRSLEPIQDVNKSRSNATFTGILLFFEILLC